VVAAGDECWPARGLDLEIYSLNKGDDFAHTDIKPAATERGSAVGPRTKS